MPKRSSKRDVNQIAKSIVDQISGETPSQSEPERTKNPAAVELGRLGGLKGGRARAAKLSTAERKKIAQDAAKARWGKEPRKK